MISVFGTLGNHMIQLGQLIQLIVTGRFWTHCDSRPKNGLKHTSTPVDFIFLYVPCFRLAHLSFQECCVSDQFHCHAQSSPFSIYPLLINVFYQFLNHIHTNAQVFCTAFYSVMSVYYVLLLKYEP